VGLLRNLAKKIKCKKDEQKKVMTFLKNVPACTSKCIGALMD
jgi:hypothetical protein